MRKAVVTVGYDKSLHGIAILEALVKLGYEVSGVVIVRTFNVKRLRRYIKMYGLKTVKEKFKTLILRMPGTSLGDETEYIKRYLREYNITHTSVSQLCKENKIPFKFVNELNGEESLSAVSSWSPDLIIYSGGGILKKKLISIPKHGVLNAHSGPLPFFRGMNAIEWTVLYGFTPVTTVHFINAGIDTGEILFTEDIPAEETFDIYKYRGMGTRHTIETLTKVLANFDDFLKAKREQNPKEGKQFFVMHPFLKEIVQKKLASAAQTKPYRKEEKGLFS